MKKIPIQILILSLSFLLLNGCGSGRKMVHIEKPGPSYNPEAMNHMIKGAIEDLFGNPKNALVDYHQAAEIDTSSPGIYLAIAENYFLIDEVNSSIRMLRKALQIESDNLDALELLASCYEKKRQFRSALLVYEKIAKVEPYNLENLFKLTSMHIASHSYERAMQTYDQMVKNGFTDLEYRMQIGHMFLQKRAYHYAKLVYNNIQTFDPDYETPYLALAAVCKAEKDTSRALYWYRRALDENARFEEVKAELHVLAEKLKKWDEAIEIYKSLIEKGKADLTDKLKLGQYFFHKGDTTAAVKWFEQILQENPGNERPYLALGIIKGMQGDTLDAEQLYREALEKNDRFLEIRRNLRDIYVRKYLYDDAISLYRPLQKSDTTYVGATIEIANLTVQKGDTSHAIDILDRLVEEHPDDWRVPLTLGRLFFLRAEYNKAAPHFDKAIELQENLPDLWMLRGINYLQLDSLGRAEDNFLNAVKKFPAEPDVNYYLGVVYNRQERDGEAIVYFQKAIEKDPENIQALLSLAALLDEKQNFDRSEAIYEKLIKLKSNSPIILNNYAYHLSVRNSRLEEALEMIQNALQADPKNPAYWDTLGWIYFRLGNYEQARINIEKSIEIRSDSAEVFEHLGDVYEKLGDHERAKLHWQKSLQLDEDRSVVREKLDNSMR